MKRGTIFTLVWVVLHTTKSHPSRSDRSIWPSYQPPAHNYVRVPLLEPRMASNVTASTSWYSEPSIDSSTDTTGISRHLEWLDESYEDGDSADSGLLDGVLGDTDDNDAEKTDAELRQRRRRRYSKVHRVMMPLLLAYKLKYFTLVPLLLGALVLLVYTTGLAGFFFALFAAATGLHIKGGRH